MRVHSRHAEKNGRRKEGRDAKVRQATSPHSPSRVLTCVEGVHGDLQDAAVKHNEGSE